MPTTEPQIFQRLSDSFKAAAEACDGLANEPKTGPNYLRLRRHLKLIEGAARQAAHWREDSRWLKVGVDVAHCHEMAGAWLRSHAPRTYFTKLAAALRNLHKSTERLRTQATGQRGAILPVPLRVLRRSPSLPGWDQSGNGVFMPTAGSA